MWILWSLKVPNACSSPKHAAAKTTCLNLMAVFLGIILTWDTGNTGNMPDKVLR